MRMTASTHERGIVALVSVMVIASIVVIYGLSIALMNIDESLSAQARLQGSQAGSLTTACVANALAVLRNNNAASGNININVSNVNCRAIVSGSGNTRTVNAGATTTGTFGDEVVGRSLINVNIATNPFTILQYNDILE